MRPLLGRQALDAGRWCFLRSFAALSFSLLPVLLPPGSAGAVSPFFEGAGQAWAARPAVGSTGALSALVIFAKFQGEVPGDEAAPAWATGLFDRNLPGSFAHFYDEMSGGLLQVAGEVLPRRYSARQPAAAYLAETPGSAGRYGQFNLEILEQADRDTDLGGFDNDGPDRVPNSGDDDGYVDIVFINLLTVPRDFLVGTATGLASLGLDTDYLSDDAAAGGGVIRVRSRFTGFGGTTQRGHTFRVTAATMCHEFGHIMGLVDLFDQSSLTANGQLDPAEDSAGVGKWDLMGLGTLGWGVEDGPNAFSAWSLAQLGWVEVVEIGTSVRDLVVEEMLKGRKVYKIPLTREEYFLLENRQASGSYYNRNVPASGLLIWHVDERADNDEEQHKQVDLVCADGLFADRGFPGEQPDPVAGRDNLDFWAKDEAYAAAHHGNQGDATDPFDGVRFTRFAYDTNPRLSAHTGFSRNLPLGVAVENIRAEGTRMVVDGQLRQPLAGHVRADTVWSGVVDAIGDVVVEPGARLTIAPGAQVRFASFDWNKSGFDANLCELLVFGELELQGTAAAPVRFTGSQSRSQWAGIFLLDGQDPDLEQVRIENATRGLVRFRLPPGQTRWSGSQRIPLDLVVPVEAELVVEAGARVGFAREDLSRRGVVPGLVELIIEGKLTVAGTAARPVRFTLELLQQDALWYGVRLAPGARVQVDFAQMDQAGFGFNGEVSAASTLRIADSQFLNLAGRGLLLTLNGQAEVERTTFTRITGQAIRAEGSGQLALRQVTVQGNGQEGIFLGNAGLEAASAVVERNGRLDPADPRSGLKAVGGRGQRITLVDSRIGSNTLHGLELDGWEGSLALRGGRVGDNQEDGVRVAGAAQVTLEGVAVEQNLGRGAAIEGGAVEVDEAFFVGNTGTGLVLTGGAVGRVQGSAFQGGPGLEVVGCDSLVVRTSRFSQSPLGLVARDAGLRVEANRLTDNVTALQVRGSRVPAAVRRNIFAGNTRAVENLAALVLPAQENYWGTADSAAIAALIAGPVAWSPFLEEEPDLTTVGEEAGLPARFALEAAYPNPFNHLVTIPFAVAVPGRVELVVYDALGRPIRRLVDAVLAPGAYRAGWDGRDRVGRPAASGVYLVQLRAGDRVATGRLALVR